LQLIAENAWLYGLVFVYLSMSKDLKGDIMIKKKAIIVDVDGTLALMKGIRGPFDHDKVHLDKPNKPVIDLVKALLGPDPKARQFPVDVFIFSGRMDVPFDTPISPDSMGDDCKSVGDLTAHWLDKHLGWDVWDSLSLRKDGDYRKDSIVKKEMFDTIKDTHDVLWVIDDRDQVVDMWRNDLGLPTLQVADGKF